MCVCVCHIMSSYVIDIGWYWCHNLSTNMFPCTLVSEQFVVSTLHKAYAGCKELHSFSQTPSLKKSLPIPCHSTTRACSFGPKAQIMWLNSIPMVWSLTMSVSSMGWSFGRISTLLAGCQCQLLRLWTNTPLEHTPKPLPTGYNGIPFIVGQGDCLGCTLGVCCNFLGQLFFKNMFLFHTIPTSSNCCIQQNGKHMVLKVDWWNSLVCFPCCACLNVWMFRQIDVDMLVIWCDIPGSEGQLHWLLLFCNSHRRPMPSTMNKNTYIWMNNSIHNVHIYTYVYISWTANPLFLGGGNTQQKSKTLFQNVADRIPFFKVWVWHADHDDCSDFVMVGMLDGCQPPVESV